AMDTLTNSSTSPTALRVRHHLEAWTSSFLFDSTCAHRLRKFHRQLRERFAFRELSKYATMPSSTTILCCSTISITLHSIFARHSLIKGDLTCFPFTG